MSFVVEFRPLPISCIPEITSFLKEPTVSQMDHLYALSKLLLCHSMKVTSLASAFLIYSIADIQHSIRPAIHIISLLKDSNFDVRKKSSAVLFKLLNESEYFTLFFLLLLISNMSDYFFSCSQDHFIAVLELLLSPKTDHDAVRVCAHIFARYAFNGKLHTIL